MPYPDKFYPVVHNVAWVTRLALLGAGTIQLRAKDLNESEALQIVTDALEAIKGTPAKLVVNDYWRAAIVAGAKHLHLGQEDLVDADLREIRVMHTKPSTVIASEAKQSIGTANSATIDCFVASLLAMTEDTPTSVIPGRAQREPGISRHNVEIPDRPFGPSGMTTR